VSGDEVEVADADAEDAEAGYEIVLKWRGESCGRGRG
jgi:hypothetical protein